MNQTLQFYDINIYVRQMKQWGESEEAKDELISFSFVIQSRSLK